jgi:hypothetical protein
VRRRPLKTLEARIIGWLHRLLHPLMRRAEEQMIRRLLRQRDQAWSEADRYRQNLKLKVGEFLPFAPSQSEGDHVEES